MTATTLALPRVPRVPFGRLLAVELRKSVDTRAGVVLLVLAALLTVGPAGWQLTHLDDGVPTFLLWASTTRGGVALLLPVLGILAMTSEWTQRTALTTFTLVPRRGRVLAAKLVAALVLGAVTMAFALVCAAGALLVASAVHDTTPVWEDAGRAVAGALVAAGLNVVMGAAFGALLQQTAVAVSAYLLVPTLWQLAAPALLGDGARWLDVFGAFGSLVDLETAGHWPQIATSIGAWVVLPLLLGTWRSLRRDAS